MFTSAFDRQSSLGQADRDAGHAFAVPERVAVLGVDRRNERPHRGAEQVGLAVDQSRVAAVDAEDRADAFQQPHFGRAEFADARGRRRRG